MKNPITDRKQAESVQAFLARTCGGTADEPFFQTLARYLAHSLDMDFVCIDRLDAKEALQESEARFKALHNASFGGIAIHDKGLILDCNRGRNGIYPETFLNERTGGKGAEGIGQDMLRVTSEKTSFRMNNVGGWWKMQMR